MTIHTNVGYGIDVTEMPLISKNIVEVAKKYAPEAYESLLYEYSEEELLSMEGEDLKDAIAEATMCGIADILAEAIKKETGFNVEPGCDDDGCEYVYVIPSFPWNNKRPDYTREELDAAFIKFTSLIAPDYKVNPETIEYQYLCDNEY